MRNQVALPHGCIYNAAVADHDEEFSSVQVKDIIQELEKKEPDLQLS